MSTVIVNARRNMDLWNNNIGREEYRNWTHATDSGATTEAADVRMRGRGECDLCA